MNRLLLLLALLLLPLCARAEQQEVRIVMPYGLPYLPVYVAVDGGMIQKHASAAGLGQVKVTVQHVASGPASSDLILSGDADLAMGGFGPAFVLWDKTRGANKVRIVSPLSGGRILLLTNDPRLKSIRDLGSDDRIAISGLKVTGQAVALQMAAAKEFGWDQRFKLDSNLVAMSNPDGMAIVLGGKGEVRSQLAIAPFSVEMLETGKVHAIMDSGDYLEPGSTVAVLFGSAKFHDGSPKLYAATAAALEEAFAFIHDHPHEASEMFVAREPQKQGVAWIEAMIKDPTRIYYNSTPKGLMRNAEFMVSAGTMKTKPESWKDLVWDNLWGKDGS
jgi:NitT/TauT family transport system substrate-binding protein